MNEKTNKWTVFSDHIAIWNTNSMRETGLESIFRDEKKNFRALVDNLWSFNANAVMIINNTCLAQRLLLSSFIFFLFGMIIWAMFTSTVIFNYFLQGKMQSSKSFNNSYAKNKFISMDKYVLGQSMPRYQNLMEMHLFKF